jgi:hypothetical protein
MCYFMDHSKDLRCCLFFNGLIHFSESQCAQCTFLTFRAIDSAFYLFDFNCCHLCFSLENGELRTENISYLPAPASFYPLNTFSIEIPRC